MYRILLISLLSLLVVPIVSQTPYALGQADDEESQPYTFEILAEPYEVTVGSISKIYGKICPDPFPHYPYTNYLGTVFVDGYVTKPDGSIVDHPHSGFTILDAYCGVRHSLQVLTFDMVGTWTIYEEARWKYPKSDQEVVIKSNVIEIKVNEKTFQNNKLEKIFELQQLKEELGIERGSIELQDWSPDGQFILFRYEGKKFSSLAIMRSDGTEIQSLALPEHLSVRNARFSPTGELIIFSAYDGHWNLYIYDAKEKKVWKVTDSTTEVGVDNFDWAPDGNIVYREGFILWLADHNGNKIRMLHNDTYSKPWEGYHFNSINVSPDGNKIVFENGWNGKLMIYDTKENEIMYMKTSFRCGQPIPQWAPDSFHVIHLETCAGKGFEEGRRGVVSLDGSVDEILFDSTTTGDLSVHVGYPVISPDGSLIIFTIDDEVYRLELARSIPEFPIALLILASSITGFIVIGRYVSRWFN